MTTNSDRSAGVFDLMANIATLPSLQVGRETTSAEVIAATRVLCSFSHCLVGVVRFSGMTPWERHRDDELLYVVGGAVEVSVLAAASPTMTYLTKGAIFVVPAGLWHRQRPQPAVSLMFVTPSVGTEASWLDDPRNVAIA